MIYITTSLYLCVIVFTLIQTHMELLKDTTYELDAYEKHLINVVAKMILSTQKLLKLVNSFIFVIFVTILYINLL